MLKSFVAMISLCAVAVVANAVDTTPAHAAPAAPSIGACRWFCGSSPKAFVTAAACQAVCTEACDEIC
jgi:hypothetical protein